MIVGVTVVVIVGVTDGVTDDVLLGVGVTEGEGHGKHTLLEIEAQFLKSAP